MPEGERRLREARTEGETFPLALTKDLGSPPPASRDRLRGQTPLSLRDISPQCGESPTQRGRTNGILPPLHKGAFLFPAKNSKKFPSSCNNSDTSVVYNYRSF